MMLQSVVIAICLSTGALVLAQSSSDVGVSSALTKTGGAATCVPLQLIPSIEVSNGVSVFSDQTCERDGTNCVPLTYCRKCKLYDTDLSSTFNPCPANVYPAVAPPSQINCPSYLYPEEPSSGISAIYDAQCPLYGGKGCVPNGVACRRCLLNASSGLDYHPCDLNTCLPSAVVTLKGAVGILDPQCNDAGTSTLVGCIPFTSCRLCRLDKNEDNAYLTNCATLIWPPSVEVDNLAEEVSVALSAGALTDMTIPWPNLDVNFTSMTAALQSFSLDVGQDVFGKTMASGAIISVVLAVVLVLLGIVALAVYVKFFRVKAVTTMPIISKPITPGHARRQLQEGDPDLTAVV